MGLISYDPLSTAGGGAFDADANTLITPSTPIVLDEATGDEAALTLDYTVNKASGNDTGLLINQTDTLSPGTSKLLDLQVGGASKFSVDNAGAVSIGAGIQHTAAGGGNVARTIVAGVQRLDVGATAIGISSGASIAWNSSNYSSSSGDLLLTRDAAGTLAQRNGINAQTFNLYNTYTNATDYERAHIGWNDTADTFVIGTEAAGTGVVRDLQLKIGADRVFGVDTALFNTSAGESALADALQTGVGNTATGYQALYLNSAGNYNNASGYRALYINSTGDYNNATGSSALNSNTIGGGNNATGYQVLYSNTEGDFNDGSGFRSLYSNVDGSNNTALGYRALFNNVSGSYGVAVGHNALLNSTGSGNIGIGASSGGGITSGTYNLAAGHQTLLNANGSYNIALGWQSARYQSGGTVDLTSADDSIFIGKFTKGVDAATNQIVIGDSAEGLGSNTTVIGSAATTLTKLHGDVDAGKVLAGSGSASAPAYSFAADSADGIYRSGASSISIAVAGGKRQEFWSDGSIYMNGSAAVLRIEDTYIARDAANTLAQRNGVNAQTYNLYNTYTDASNYERGHIGWNDTADTFVIGTEAAGTGTLRKISIDAPHVSASTLFRAPRIDATGSLGFLSSNGRFSHLNSNTPMRLNEWPFTAGVNNVEIGNETHTNSSGVLVQLAIVPTYNQSSTAGATDLLINRTEASTGSGTQLLIDAQVGGVSKFSVDPSGDVVGSSGYKISPRGGATSFLYSLALSDRLGFSSNAGPFLQADAANTLGQRNGVNAQTYNLYNTADTNLTNYERAHIGWNDTADTFVIGTEAAGTGVVRDIALMGNVGIGTASPSDRLHVHGDARFTTSVGIGLSIEPGNASSRIGNTHANDDMILATGKNLIFQCWDGAVHQERVRFEPGGNVGIGTTTPTVALDVSGSIAATGTIKATPTTVGALPAAATAGAGARTFVTDSANSLSSHHGQTVTGGGTDFSPVYSDGTTWRVG